MRWLLVCALLSSLGSACGDDADRLSRQDCEAVIAHLVVLEKLAEEGSDGPMCKYHESCDGSQRKLWFKQCPRVLTPKIAHCYQRATSVSSADDCLARTDLDERIQTGDTSRGGQGYGGGGGFGFGGLGGGGGGSSPAQSLIRDLRSLRDDACACKDADCARRVEDRFTTFSKRYEDLKTDPQLQADAEKIATAAMDCLGKVIAYPSTIDAGTPDAGTVDLYDLPECERYSDAMEQYLRCDKIPQSSRDAMKQGFDAMKQSWAQIPADQYDAKRAADDACLSAVEGLEQSASALGCTIY